MTTHESEPTLAFRIALHLVFHTATNRNVFAGLEKLFAADSFFVVQFPYLTFAFVDRFPSLFSLTFMGLFPSVTSLFLFPSFVVFHCSSFASSAFASLIISFTFVFAFVSLIISFTFVFTAVGLILDLTLLRNPCHCHLPRVHRLLWPQCLYCGVHNRRANHEY